MAGETQQLTQNELEVLSAIKRYPSLYGAIRHLHEALQSGYAEVTVTVHRHQITNVDATTKSRIEPDGSSKQLTMTGEEAA